MMSKPYGVMALLMTAASGVPVIIMHMQGQPGMQEEHYDLRLMFINFRRADCSGNDAKISRRILPSIPVLALARRLRIIYKF